MTEGEESERKKKERKKKKKEISCERLNRKAKEAAF